ELQAAQLAWELRLDEELSWQVLTPTSARLESNEPLSVGAGGAVSRSASALTTTFTIQFAAPDAATLSALRLEARAVDTANQDADAIVTGVRLTLTPPPSARSSGRYVRVTLPGDERILSLAEVQVFSGDDNVATGATATQSSTAYEGAAERAIDGNTDGDYFSAKSTTHTEQSTDPWWEVDLGRPTSVDRLVVWNRTDGDVGARLQDFHVTLLDDERKVVWEHTVAETPIPSEQLRIGGPRDIVFATAVPDEVQDGFDAAAFVQTTRHADGQAKPVDEKPVGWKVLPSSDEWRSIVLPTNEAIEVPAGSRLTIAVEQAQPTLAALRVSATGDARAGELASIPPSVLAVLRTAAGDRTDAQRDELAKYFLSVAPELQQVRERLAVVKKQLDEVEPYTTVPIMEELVGEKTRTTRIQRRGNFLDVGDEVTPGLPSAFVSAESGAAPDRLTLARWLVDGDNPLTARVVVNRYWEAIFGTGLVSTSEEFGSQGDLPTNRQLLDWLATELVRLDWDTKALVKQLVTSAAYRQSSAVTEESYERDPDNLMLARGPRFRLPAEVIRDQALSIGGLLSEKMYGPPVMPPQPELGVRAAFGGDIDWTTSEGEDRHRRGLYTNWRRSNPYPSMAAFDAPNREVCTVRRSRTNTPLQALVTLNDTVYIEAAQGLARRTIARDGDTLDRAGYAFRLCLARPPSDEERAALAALYVETLAHYTDDHDAAIEMATVPLGPAPDGVDVADLAAWTVVSNVLLNLDELFLKR
ncbi:MAG: DUF1553 domain-containing protein, partial [Planctomycetales bacterium]|nr:DUF1553 domain-containing protein [Planctomycetales bacterium]